VLHVVLLTPGPLGEIHNIFVLTGTVTGWRKEHPVENILLTIFFVELGKSEICSHIVRLSFLRCETRVVRAHLPSTCARTV
jgi:hypothetical protein